MKAQPPNQYRRRGLDMGRFRSDDSCGMNGAFSIPLPGFGHKVIANCIVSDGSEVEDMPELRGWEHVSVHVVEFGKQKVPTWEQMCAVKDIFWDAEETVCQFHPAKSRYVNCHPCVLHLWKKREGFPTPPIILV